MASIETNPLNEPASEPELMERHVTLKEIDDAVTRGAVPGGLSVGRLTRPVHVITAEHLGWYAIAIWAVITRLLALGARPLDAAAARTALLERALAREGLQAVFAYPGLHASWPEIVQAWIFAALGASDITSRIVVAGCALLLIAAAASMRPYMGRAGAMGFAGLLAISPSITYFSRGGSNVICSMAFVMASVALAMSMRHRRFPARAFVLGCTIALFLTADPIGYSAAAAMIISLLFIGLFDLLTVDHRRLRFKIWWEQRRVMVLTSTFVAIFAWFWLATGLMTYSLSQALPRDLHGAFITDVTGFARGVLMMVPMLAFYEFLIALLAVTGVIAVVARRVTGPVARWSIIWAIVSVAFLLTLGATGPDAISSDVDSARNARRLRDRMDASVDTLGRATNSGSDCRRSYNLYPADDQFCVCDAERK